jgi:tRNA(Arg) A34 adenosine deaminase TadA
MARENVQWNTGGPFGAAVFQMESGKLIAVGMNRVVPLKNSTLHAEMVAFMTAQARLGSHSLGLSELPAHELVTSCDPCAMCLGAVLWSGVRRVPPILSLHRASGGRDRAGRVERRSQGRAPTVPRSRGAHLQRVTSCSKRE